MAATIAIFFIELLLSKLPGEQRENAAMVAKS
jgi:hypothetical protein